MSSINSYCCDPCFEMTDSKHKGSKHTNLFKPPNIPIFLNPQSRKTKSKPLITKFKPHITNHNYWQPEQQKTWWPWPKPMLPESKNKTVTAITNQCISIVPANLLTLKVPNKMPDYVWFLEGKSKYSSIIIMWSNVHNKKHIKTICPTFQFEV